VRRSILSAVLLCDIVENEALPEALAIYNAHQLVPNKDSTFRIKDGVLACLSQYRLDRNRPASELVEALDFQALEWI
jgi:hypothetical protein